MCLRFVGFIDDTSLARGVPSRTLVKIASFASFAVKM
jgi:hypothetical protein